MCEPSPDLQDARVPFRRINYSALTKAHNPTTRAKGAPLKLKRYSYGVSGDAMCSHYSRPSFPPSINKSKTTNKPSINASRTKSPS